MAMPHARARRDQVQEGNGGQSVGMLGETRQVVRPGEGGFERICRERGDGRNDEQGPGCDRSPSSRVHGESFSASEEVAREPFRDGRRATGLDRWLCWSPVWLVSVLQGQRWRRFPGDAVVVFHRVRGVLVRAVVWDG